MAKAKKKSTGWGGRRAGSGRPRISRAERDYVPHTPRPEVTEDRPVFARFDCVDGLPSLRTARPRRIVEAIFAAESRKGFRLVHYSIQTDHILVLCEGDDTEAVSRGLQRVGARIARRMNEHLGRKGRFFRERFYSEVLTTGEQVRDRLRFVLLAHQRLAHERGTSIPAGLDPVSSAKWLDGWLEPWASDTCAPGPDDPVVSPTSRLLRHGWLKRGRLAAEWPES